MFFLYQTLIDTVGVNMSWAGGVLWLHWSSPGWRETFRSHINNGAPIVNTPSPLWRFSLRVFLKGQIQPRYCQGRSSLPRYLLSGLFTLLPVLSFVCSWVSTLIPSGKKCYLNISFSQFWAKSEPGCYLCSPGYQYSFFRRLRTSSPLDTIKI